MPDLSHAGSHEFWKSYPDDTLYKTICFMEGVEDWTLDGHPELEAALDALGEQLDHIDSVSLDINAEMVNLVAHIKTGRGLRTLMALDQAYPGSASKVIMHAEQTTETNSDTAGIFLRRNIVFERLRLLSRVFSADRCKLILNILENEHEN